MWILLVIIFRYTVRKLRFCGKLICFFHVLDGWKMWRNLTFLVAFPGVALCMLNVYLGLDDAEAHSAPPFVAYEYMRIRNKASLA